jgi:hypothetical protein
MNTPRIIPKKELLFSKITKSLHFEQLIGSVVHSQLEIKYILQDSPREDLSRNLTLGDKCLNLRG